MSAGLGISPSVQRRTLGRLPPSGSAVRLFVETHVREDHIHLYGFIDAGERDWFRLLTTVQGVGARLALAVLSTIAPEALTLAIAAQDKAALARADGVGPRLAARIVNELRDKVRTRGRIRRACGPFRRIACGSAGRCRRGDGR